MNKFIVLEGLSGTGKTTIGRVLAEEMGALFYATPPEMFKVMRENVDRFANIQARFFYYLSSVFFASQEIGVALGKQSVVCDRYIYTTLCYHRALGFDIQIPGVLQRVLVPDETFLVVCRDDIRAKRMQLRGKTINDVSEEKNGVDKAVLAAFREFGFTEVDNSDDDVNVAVEQIFASLGSTLRGTTF